jgi:hypothetical protein
VYIITVIVLILLKYTIRNVIEMSVTPRVNVISLVAFDRLKEREVIRRRQDRGSGRGAPLVSGTSKREREREKEEA